VKSGGRGSPKINVDCGLTEVHDGTPSTANSDQRTVIIPEQSDKIVGNFFMPRNEAGVAETALFNFVQRLSEFLRIQLL
jgi:hypothetical protein